MNAPKVDVLAVLDRQLEFTIASDYNGAMQDHRDLVAAKAAVAELIAFVENIATPMSEPLNSAVGYRSKAQRRHFMGIIRANARAALARAGGAA